MPTQLAIYSNKIIQYTCTPIKLITLPCKDRGIVSEIIYHVTKLHIYTHVGTINSNGAGVNIKSGSGQFGLILFCAAIG